MIANAQPLLGAEERGAVLQMLASGQLTQREQVAAFERRFAELCQVQEAEAGSSGTAALHLALLAHGIGPGDEVITTPFSFVATANATRLVGAAPVFVDIEPDPCDEAAITPRTTAILPVHLCGNPCDMQHLEILARRHHLLIIEDACQAHAAAFQGKPVGSFGAGCFSFYAAKNMTTGEGGMVTMNDRGIAQRLRLLRSHGQMERYHHRTMEYTLRLPEMQAALGTTPRQNLRRFTEARISNAAFLTERLNRSVHTPVVRPGHRHVYHQHTSRVPRPRVRDAWVQAFGEHGIGIGVHYPRRIHQQPAYREQGFTAHLPVAEAAAREVLSLPVHPAVNVDDLSTITREVIASCTN